MNKYWKRMKLIDVIQKTETINPQRNPDSSFEYIDVSSICNKQFRIQETSTILGKDAPSRARKFVRTGDILFATVRPTLKRIAQVPEYLDSQVCSTGYFVLRPKDFVEARFLFYFLFTKHFMEAMEQLQKGASYPAVNDSEVSSQTILIPPLSEQKRIVSIVDGAFEAIDIAINNTKQNLTNARELFDSYLQSLDSEKESLGSLVDIKTGKLDANAATDNGQYPFFTCSREIYKIDNFAFDCEAILLAGNNAIGDFNVKHYKGKFNAYQRTYVITVNKENKILYRYLYFQMLKSLKGFKLQSVGSGTKFLKIGMIQGLQMALPSIDEQQEILSVLDKLATETQRLEAIYRQKLTALNELKQSILHKAFTGELTADKADLKTNIEQEAIAV